MANWRYKIVLSPIFKKVKKVESCDRLMNHLYNFADSHGIWVEVY